MAPNTQANAELHAHRLTAALIPADVRKALGPGELADRIGYAERLSRAAYDASDPVLAGSYASIAKAMLAAPPRDDVARQHRELMARADALPAGPHQDAVRALAAQLLEQNPAAPSPEEQARNTGPVAPHPTRHLGQGKARPPQPAADRLVAKAASQSPLLAVYDQHGCLTGAVDPAKVIPVSPGCRQPGGVASAGPKPERPRGR